MSLLSFFSRPTVKQALQTLLTELGIADAPAVAEAEAPAPTYAERVAAVVAKLSNPKYKFRSTAALAKAAGTTIEEGLADILAEAGARQATKRGVALDSWGLVSRVGAGRGLPDPNIAKVKSLLSNSKYKFRNIDTLMSKLGITDESAMEELLETAGAVPARRNDRLYRLPGHEPVSVGGGYDDDDDDDDEFGGE